MSETKRLRLKRTTETHEDVDVTFPLYRRHRVDIDEADIVHFSRVNADGSTITITRTWSHRTRSFELEAEGPRPFGEQSDYTLGRGEYSSTAEEFAEVLDEFNEDLGKLGFRMVSL